MRVEQWRSAYDDLHQKKRSVIDLPVNKRLLKRQAVQILLNAC